MISFSEWEKWVAYVLSVSVVCERTLHSHKVHESFFHRSPSVRSRPSLSVQPVLLRRVSSLLICKETRIFIYYSIYPLFNQKGPIEIQYLFHQGVLVKKAADHNNEYDKEVSCKKKKYKDGYDTAKTQHTRQKTYGDQGLKRIMADSNTS